jgi:hypothetical protein
MRKSTFFLIYILINVTVIGLLGFHALQQQKGDQILLKVKAALVGQLGLTDLCLFTEASYTRHPSMADRHTPFKDSPFSLEHFPSGSLVSPPQGRTINAKVD